MKRRLPAVHLLFAAVLSLLCASAGAQPASFPHGRAPAGRVPELWGEGVFSSPLEEWRIVFTRDGKTAYFGRSEEFFPISRQAFIYESHFERGRWTQPVVASFSGEYSDLDPFISPDGQRLFFSSIRPVDGVARADADLWMVQWTDEGWGEPVNLGDAVNSAPGDELYPSVTADGTLYFASDRDGISWNLYRSTPVDGVYGPAEPLNLNTDAAWEFNPWVSADGQLLLFTGLFRPDSLGLGDLYASCLGADGRWSEPVNLGAPINSALDEYHASVTPDGKSLVFVRHSYDPFVPGDFYAVSTHALRKGLACGDSLRR